MVLLEETLEIAKTPQEYGLPYIEQRYTEFRDRFFDGDNGPLPKKMEFKFNRSLRRLGTFTGTVHVYVFMNSRHVHIDDCHIELSNAYDFTKKQLDEVIIHEMVHAYFAFLDNNVYKENHGPRFLRKCDSINSASDYNITVRNEDPLTLNQGTANRIADDNTIFMVGECSENEYYIARINRKDSGWYQERLESWLKVPFRAYSCNDANFKSQFTVRKKCAVTKYPKRFIDTMIADNVMKECEIAKRDFSDDVLIAWKSGDTVSYTLCTKAYAPMAKDNIDRLGLVSWTYDVYDGFPGWPEKPVNSGRVSYQTVDSGTFRQWVANGLVNPSTGSIVESVAESSKSVMYRGFNAEHSADGDVFDRLGCPEKAMWVTPDINYAIQYASLSGDSGRVARITTDESKVFLATMDDLEEAGLPPEFAIDVGDDPETVEKLKAKGITAVYNYLDDSENGYCLLDPRIVEEFHVMTPEELAGAGADTEELEYLGCDDWYSNYTQQEKQTLVEMVVYKKGHKNSKGESAPWTIVSHETGKILSSHKSKSAAKEHLRQMEYFKHKKPQTEGIKDLSLASEFSRWIDKQPRTPVVEAVIKLYRQSN